MSPRMCTAKLEAAKAVARMLGATTLAMIALLGPVLASISNASAKNSPRGDPPSVFAESRPSR